MITNGDLFHPQDQSCRYDISTTKRKQMLLERMKKQKPKQNPRKRRLKNTKSTTNPNSTKKVKKNKSDPLVWVWQYLDGDYFNYDEPASDLVEAIYQNYLISPGDCDVHSVKSGCWNYEIDFRIMQQRNLGHEDHTSRQIRRIQIPLSEKSDNKKKYAVS